MSTYTDEQLKYINYIEHNHTKLLACAGSGKTRCIIARMVELIKRKIYEVDTIRMLTFSRFTRDDFIRKIKSNNAALIPVSIISTIDKFAKQIIDPNSTVDVSLLSFKLMTYLEETSEKDLKKNMSLSKIKIIFVDEAQDLNEVQYRIFCAMRDKLGTIINMVGDPNQNIYQFRNSSDKYLREFEAVTFQLTRNFRSYSSIVNFSKYLRPFDEYDVICTKGDNDCLPSLMFYDNEKTLEEYILDILRKAKKNKIDLSTIAILSPTRGYMKGCGRSYGLCFISNILYKANIKFKQFYEESTDEMSNEGIKYEPEKNHVNILTYMGSKGLEWDYVIIVDIDACLINKRHFNEDKHNYDRYLLYVACSRAICNMFMFSKCTYRRGDYHFNTNPWLADVPEQYYHLDNFYANNFYFPKLNFKDTGETPDDSVNKIIDKLNFNSLDEISNLLDFQNRRIKHQHRIFRTDYSSIEKTSSIFLSRYTDTLFHVLYNLKIYRKTIPFPDIEHIIEGDTIITDVSDNVASWYFKNKKNMTWEKFDNIRNMDNLIKDAINHKFNRTKAFNSHVISSNDYYQTFILEQKKGIKNLYTKYLRCRSKLQIRDMLFNLMVIRHALNTQHYFHIKDKGKKYAHILEDFKDMFDDIQTYIDDLDYNFVKSNEITTHWDLSSKIDLIDEDNNLWYIKCSDGISLKHTIISIVSHLMYNMDKIDNTFELLNYEGKIDISGIYSESEDSDTVDNEVNNKIEIIINYINFLKGEEISYIYYLQPDTIRRIISILRDAMTTNKDETLTTQSMKSVICDKLINDTNLEINQVMEDI